MRLHSEVGNKLSTVDRQASSGRKISVRFAISAEAILLVHVLASSRLKASKLFENDSVSKPQINREAANATITPAARVMPSRSRPVAVRPAKPRSPGKIVELKSRMNTVRLGLAGATGE